MGRRGSDVPAHALRERPDHERSSDGTTDTIPALDRMADAAAAALHRCGIDP